MRAGGTGAPGYGHLKLRLIEARGHTDGDLLVYDELTKTLFTGDLVFFQRAPTTPSADIGQWLATLDAIDQLDFTVLVRRDGSLGAASGTMIPADLARAVLEALEANNAYRSFTLDAVGTGEAASPPSSEIDGVMVREGGLVLRAKGSDLMLCDPAAFVGYRGAPEAPVAAPPSASTGGPARASRIARGV